MLWNVAEALCRLTQPLSNLWSFIWVYWASLDLRVHWWFCIISRKSEKGFNALRALMQQRERGRESERERKRERENCSCQKTNTNQEVLFEDWLVSRLIWQMELDQALADISPGMTLQSKVVNKWMNKWMRILFQMQEIIWLISEAWKLDPKPLRTKIQI